MMVDPISRAVAEAGLIVKSEVASSSEEQKMAHGNLWEMEPYNTIYSDGNGDKFRPIFEEACHKLGFEAPPPGTNLSTGKPREPRKGRPPIVKPIKKRKSPLK